MTISHPLLASVLAAALTTSGFSSTEPPLPVPPPAGDGLLSEALHDLGTLLGTLGSPEVPADLLDFSNWKLTLPTGEEGSPKELLSAALPDFTNEYFRVNESRDGVVFTAEVGGATTRNSSYPRSELREMQGDRPAAWSNPGGTHTLSTRQAILVTPKAKPEVVAAQIHDGDDDVLQIRLEGQVLTVQSDDGQSETVLDPAYRLGTPYDLRIVAEDGRIDVFYNGEKKAELTKSGTGWYFKVGAYVQSSTEKGDEPGTPGAVAVYSLEVTHTDGPDAEWLP
jgi:hypothetical protein